MSKKAVGMERDFILDMLINDKVRLVSESTPDVAVQLVSRNDGFLQCAEEGAPFDRKGRFSGMAGGSQVFTLELEPSPSRGGRKFARIPESILCSDKALSRSGAPFIALRIALSGKELIFSANEPAGKTGHSLVFPPSGIVSATDISAMEQHSRALATKELRVLQDLHLPALFKLCARNGSALILDRVLGIPEQDPTIGSSILTRSQFEEAVKRMDTEEKTQIKQELQKLASLEATVFLYPSPPSEAASSPIFAFATKSGKLDADSLITALGWLDAALACVLATVAASANSGTASRAANAEEPANNRILALFPHGLVLSSKELLAGTSSVFFLSLGKRSVRGSALPEEVARWPFSNYYYYRFEHVEPEDLRYIADYLSEASRSESAAESREFTKLCGL